MGRCGQCRAYENPGIEALVILYTGLREFPLIIFSLKTVRVSICFVNAKKTYLESWMIKIFKNESTVIIISLVYSLIISLTNFLNFVINEDALTFWSGEFTFELLCPKQSGLIDWFVTFFRYVLFAFAYTLSIKTYK